MLPNLKKMRLKKQISQQKLGEAVGLSQQAINRYENQDIEPDIATLARLADFFGTTIDDLVGHTCQQQTGEALFPTPLSAMELALIHKYRMLDMREQNAILTVLDSYQTF